MEAAIRFSQNSLSGTEQRFLHVDVSGKSFKLCQINNQRSPVVDYDVIHSSTKVPAFRAFDWHPTNEDLVVVGQAGGEATLLNIAQGQQDSVSFQVRSQRLCNAVALNALNLLAAGLDRVRTDFCLNIWDFNQRLPAPGSKGFSKNYAEPLHKLGAGEPITSIKFFQDDPQLLVAGVKGQFVRLYDLRQPSTGNGLQFTTRCVHNLAIDWRDENYFASCYPTSDPSICLWDRRMIARSNTTNTGFGGVSHSDTRQPEVSLELRNAIDIPGAIWSLRFSKSKNGRLGALSSTGHLKVFKLGKDFVPEGSQADRDEHHGFGWETKLPQDIHLDQAEDIERHYTHPSALKDEKARLVSFDFMTSQTKLGEPMILTLNGNGEIRTAATTPVPEPTGFSSVGFVCRGRNYLQHSISPDVEVGEAVASIRGRAEPRNSLRQAFKQAKSKRSTVPQRMSSFADQAWYTDLGFYETDVPVQDLLALTSVQRLRCEEGYLFNPIKNRTITSDSRWLQSFWAWVERAARISRHGNMTQDNLDLSYLGVFGLWMEDIMQKNRILGPCSSRTSKIIESLVQRLHISQGNVCPSEYPANRHICLHVSGLAWSPEELETRTGRLVAQNQHTKAAALAIFAGERKLAYKVLRVKSATQAHKMLAMAIAGAAKRSKPQSAEESVAEGDWSETITSLAEELTDPYARAILAFVKSGDWADVIAEDSLPLKYRVGIALRHLDDSKLTRYISQASKEAVAQGDVEGVILTGTGTIEAFQLFSNYISRFNDLQTAVLALCGTIPRYIDDEKVVRKFNAWKDQYRSMMNSWGLKFDRVRFDIASQRLAIDSTGRKLIEPAKAQIRLVCGYCSGSIAHSEYNGDNNDITFKSSVGGRERNSVMNLHPSESQSASPSQNLGAAANAHDTLKNPLTPDKAAAIGTVCPKCGRHLPRCGVCDLWLGMPDETYLKWYTLRSTEKQRNEDLSASLAGSVQTTLGPAGASSTSLAAKVRAGASESSKAKHVKQGMAGGYLMSREGSHNAKIPSQLSRPPMAAQAGSTTSLPGTAVHDDDGTRHGSSYIEEDREEPQQQEEKKEDEDEAKDALMSRFTVICVKCNHGFHAGHARVWFQGGQGRPGHRVCPVPRCECVCYG